MRLPSYRSSHMLRYHPYPRVGLSQRENLIHITKENDALLHINDPLRNHNIECEDIFEPDAFPGNDKQEENVLEAVEVPEAGGVLRVRRRKLTTFIIVVLLFVVRNLAFNNQCAAFHITPNSNLHPSFIDSLSTCISPHPQM
ncbi:hypothetical protein F4604DRAFT_57051 [Suillus subluteus]|nr:hypothetical protein F4604DRAFT_57051 [Suillus subluteus]